MKPGYRTTEFWLVVITAVIAALSAIADQVSPRWSVAITAALAGLYALSRGLAKAALASVESDDQDDDQAPPTSGAGTVALVALGGLVCLWLLGAGCAARPAEGDPCERYVAAYQLYKATLAAGREPSEDEVTAAAMAAAYLQLRCGWTPPRTRGAAPVAVVPVDSLGLPILSEPR